MSETLKVIALDPGITTGYVTGLIEPDSQEPMGVVSGQAKWTEFDLYMELKRSKPDIVIYESFEYRSEKLYGKRGGLYKVELFSRNLIGVINLYIQERHAMGNDCKVFKQMPSAAKAYWNDQLLKKNNVYKIANEHANDAMRHLLQWYTFGSGFQYNKNGFRSLA